MNTYYVYILSNVSRTLYIGVTNNLGCRIVEHRSKQHDSFTRQYNITLLVHLEEHSQIDDAIARGKQLKNWRRDKKIALVERDNPGWHDLSIDWTS